MTFYYSVCFCLIHEVQKHHLRLRLLLPTERAVGLFLIVSGLWAAFDKFKAWESDS